MDRDEALDKRHIDRALGQLVVVALCVHDSTAFCDAHEINYLIHFKLAVKRNYNTAAADNGRKRYDPQRMSVANYGDPFAREGGVHEICRKVLHIFPEVVVREFMHLSVFAIVILYFVAECLRAGPV